MKEIIFNNVTKKYEDVIIENLNCTFTLEKSVAFVGRNGCGKSTMLKVIAGVIKPTFGTVSVKGSVAPMIELGAGFDSELTARENIFLNGAILGYPRASGRRSGTYH